MKLEVTYSEYKMRFYFSVVDCSYNISASVFFSIYRFFLCIYLYVFVCIRFCVCVSLVLCDTLYVFGMVLMYNISGCTLIWASVCLCVLPQLMHVRIVSSIQVDYIHVWNFNLNFSVVPVFILCICDFVHTIMDAIHRRPRYCSIFCCYCCCCCCLCVAKLETKWKRIPNADTISFGVHIVKCEWICFEASVKAVV